MIEWMYSGTDPPTIQTLTGHIGHAGQGPLEAGQGKSTKNKRRTINFLAFYFYQSENF